LLWEAEVHPVAAVVTAVAADQAVADPEGAQMVLAMFSLMPMVMDHMMFVPEVFAVHIMCLIPCQRIQM